MDKRLRLRPFANRASNLIHKGKASKRLASWATPKPMPITNNIGLPTLSHQDGPPAKPEALTACQLILGEI